MGALERRRAEIVAEQARAAELEARLAAEGLAPNAGVSAYRKAAARLKHNRGRTRR